MGQGQDSTGYIREKPKDRGQREQRCPRQRQERCLRDRPPNCGNRQHGRQRASKQRFVEHGEPTGRPKALRLGAILVAANIALPVAGPILDGSWGNLLSRPRGSSELYENVRNRGPTVVFVFESGIQHPFLWQRFPLNARNNPRRQILVLRDLGNANFKVVQALSSWSVLCVGPTHRSRAQSAGVTHALTYRPSSSLSKRGSQAAKRPDFPPYHR
jgi:hypothetical protein